MTEPDNRIRIHRTTPADAYEEEEEEEESNALLEWLSGVWWTLWRFKWLTLILVLFVGFKGWSTVKKQQRLKVRVEEPFKAALQSLESQQYSIQAYRQGKGHQFTHAASTKSRLTTGNEYHTKMRAKYADQFRSRLTKDFIEKVDWEKDKGWVSFVKAYADPAVVDHMNQIQADHQAKLAEAKAAAQKAALEAMARSVHVYISTPKEWKQRAPQHLRTPDWQIQADNQDLGHSFRQAVRSRMTQVLSGVPVTFIDPNENKPVSKEKLSEVRIRIWPMEATSNWVGGRRDTVMIGCGISISSIKPLRGPTFKNGSQECGPGSFAANGDQRRVASAVSQARSKAHSDLGQYLNSFSLEPSVREALIKAAKE